jgi:hypothetical protein
VTGSPAGGGVDRDIYREIIAVADRIATLVAQPAADELTVPNSTWTIAEAAAHLAAANGHFREIAAGNRPARHGDGTKPGLASANAQLLEQFTVRDPAILGAQIRDHANGFVSQVRQRPGDDRVDTPLGEMSVDEFGGYLLTHMLGHGEGIAQARRQPSMLTAAHVALAVPFLVVVMPRLVDAAVARDLDASYELRIRDTARLAVRFERGVATVVQGPARQPVDCVISAEPRAYFLLAAGLRTTGRLIAQGKISAWGRKPWLAFRFSRAFTFP